MNDIKVLVVHMPFETDLGNLIQVARAEGMKIYRNPGKIKVLDLVYKPYGWLVVVQNGDSCISEKSLP